jgi:hypothetical protein
LIFVIAFGTISRFIYQWTSDTMIKKIDGNWYSSFLPDVQVTNHQSVATPMSGSSGTGRHSSLFVEKWRQIDQYAQVFVYELGIPKGSWVGVKVRGAMSTSLAMPDQVASLITGAFSL